MNNLKLAENCRIILVNTTHPGNIGSCARAMKTMGIEDLYIVNKNTNIIDDHAVARASGASDILFRAKVLTNLTDAIADCKYLIATSARARNISSIVYTPRQAAELAVRDYIAQNKKVGILLGQERMGLTNDEVDLCHAQLIIPTGDSYRSLNIACALQILCYEMRIEFDTLPNVSNVSSLSDQAVNNTSQHIDNSHNKINKDKAHVQAQDQELVTVEQMELFYSNLKKLLINIDFLDTKQPNMLMRRLRKLFNRAQLSQREYNIMFGITSAYYKKLNK